MTSVTSLIAPLLKALDVLEFVARHLHPPQLDALIYEALPAIDPVREALERLDQIEWPDELQAFRERLEAAAAATSQAFAGLDAALTDQNGIMQAYRSLRFNSRALASLYPIAALLPPVSRFFLDASKRDDPTLLERLEQADPNRKEVGIIHASDDRKSRGGFSLYVPEYYDSSESYPLVMALHGGSGHGSDYLWSWLRDARSFGAILVSPTAVGNTWSLMGPDQDSSNLDRILEFVGERWNLDRSRMLLTGMSDGGTFSFVSGLRNESPFTHLAPCSAAFHPMLLDEQDAARVQELPIYLMHGALDWMFPIEMARTAHQGLAEAGANLVYREIADLSHTYPRDENPRVLEWLFRAS